MHAHIILLDLVISGEGEGQNWMFRTVWISRERLGCLGQHECSWERPGCLG